MTLLSLGCCASFGAHVQTPALQHFTDYTEASLRACIVDMHTVLTGSAAAQLQAVRKKYANVKYNAVATLPFPTL